jgi:hypothetical protein
MIRIGIALGVLIIVVVGSVYVGMRWDDKSDEKAKVDTLERIQDADTSKGDTEDDRSWVLDFVDRLLSDN